MPILFEGAAPSAPGVGAALDANTAPTERRPPAISKRIRRLATGLCIGLLLLGRTRAVAACVGDCDGNGTVAISELIAGVNIALGSATVSACSPFDRNGDGIVSVDELVAGVN